MVKANEIPKEELLERDVYILFQENNRLKETIKALKKENRKLKKVVDEETDSMDDIAFYIQSQKESTGLSYDKFGALFGVSGDTMKNYARGKGSLTRAKKVAEKISNWRKKQREKIMASANKS